MPILEGSMDCVVDFDDNDESTIERVEYYANEDDIKIDYDRLPTALLDAQQDDEIRLILTRCTEELDSLNEEILGITNIKQVCKHINVLYFTNNFNNMTNRYRNR